MIVIAQQIALGMGYLHHKGIVHKDLKTKNIFLENGRAIISDFGLVNVARRLCSRHKRPGEALASNPRGRHIPCCAGNLKTKYNFWYRKIFGTIFCWFLIKIVLQQ